MRRGHQRPEINQFVTEGAEENYSTDRPPSCKGAIKRSGRCMHLLPFPHFPLSQSVCVASTAQRLRKKGNWPFRSLQGPSIRPTRSSFHCGLSRYSSSLSWKRWRARARAREHGWADSSFPRIGRPNQGLVCHRLLADGSEATVSAKVRE